jgi:hypothetical protein
VADTGCVRRGRGSVNAEVDMRIGFL